MDYTLENPVPIFNTQLPSFLVPLSIPSLPWSHITPGLPRQLTWVIGSGHEEVKRSTVNRGTRRLSFSIESGQVRPEVSSDKDDSEREKENSSSRGRSSPLRRLLDPLLKWKGTQSAQTIQPPNPCVDPTALRTVGSTGPSREKKPEASTIQALLEPTLRNGLPFFKLVVDNSTDVLVAVVKKLPTSGKSDPRMIYSFYSVHEIKKKSMNWISQGLKSENCSLASNIVGQMKSSASYHQKVLQENLS
ncbi:UNVERIFIED_CONTAM: hypothetical protein Sradi_4281400 [Sesamum radiatum]|uniref:Reverse transcriptase/retrotransposon-derived protein RNase H-like domain-containing protein n=1 Tax=Sesamum radiatum TaxID=300843 RepID=A0AAW2NPL2_SESRA